MWPVSEIFHFATTRVLWKYAKEIVCVLQVLQKEALKDLWLWSMG